MEKVLSWSDQCFGFETGSHFGLNSQSSCLSLPSAMSYVTNVSYWSGHWNRGQVLSQSSEAKFAHNAENSRAGNLRLG